MNTDQPETDVHRRTLIRVAGGAAAGLTGLAAVGSAAADGHECPCHQCWLDVKPGSCPNSINPDSGGVVSVAAGWPGFDPETVVLVPREEAWGDCSEHRSDYAGPDCETAEEWLDGDYATPVRAERYDVDGDGDADWEFKFEKQAVGFHEGIQSAVLVGRDAESGCVVWGVDSINIVGEGSGSHRRGGSNHGGSNDGGANDGRSNDGGANDGRSNDGGANDGRSRGAERRSRGTGRRGRGRSDG